MQFGDPATMDEPGRSDLAQRLLRGVARALDRQGWRSLAEFPLGNGRRADVMALDARGRFMIVEIKTSVRGPPRAGAGLGTARAEGGRR